MNWQPSAGDPTVTGWTITAGYLITALLCARRGYQSRRADGNGKANHASDWAAWSCLAALTFALGINKQLDFQTLLIEWGRTLLTGTIAFTHRRTLQKAFVILLAAAAMAAGFHARRRIIQFARHEPAAVLGLLILVFAVMVRAAEINHVSIATLPASDENSSWWILELGGILLLITGASARRKIRASGH